MTEKKSDMKLPKIDDLFTTQEDRSIVEKVISIPLKEIDNFPNHPYKVKDDDKMKEMVDSIKENGLLNPVIVRKKEDGRYEMISGHRRKRATEIAGENNIQAIVKDLTDEEAVIYMVDSNENQREEILPSEKAFAYKMKLEAMNKKAGRPKNDNLTPVVSDLRTNEILGEQNGESREQVRRYIRLTELIPEILNMVDDKKVAFRPAVEISYLNKENQYILYENMQYLDVTPSLAQAIYMKKLEQEDRLDTEMIEKIIGELKPNQVEKVRINMERFEEYMPDTAVTNQQKEDFLFQCVVEHRKRELSKSSRER